MVSVPTLESLKECSKEDLLFAVRSMEASYKRLDTTIEEDHRRHLSHGELENVYRLVSRVVELRHLDPTSPLHHQVDTHH